MYSSWRLWLTAECRDLQREKYQVAETVPFAWNIALQYVHLSLRLTPCLIIVRTHQFCSKFTIHASDLIEGGDINGLHVVLKGGNGLLQEIRANLVVFNHTAAAQEGMRP